MSDTSQTHDQREIDKFNNLAHEWWDVNGHFKTLHIINPIRLQFVLQHTDIENQNVIDVGCGGGILTEALARQGANTTGVDLAPDSIEIAKLHLHESKLDINYECIDIETKANQQGGHYDALTCMEMLEHVPNPENIIANCAKLLKPGGVAFFSTLNRNLKSYFLGVVAAEYILKLIPKGTHEYQKFIKPSELRQILTKYGLEIKSIAGLDYNPLTHKAKISNNVNINYMVACQKTSHLI